MAHANHGLHHTTGLAPMPPTKPKVTTEATGEMDEADKALVAMGYNPVRKPQQLNKSRESLIVYSPSRGM
jgi:hypothetical protein